jgi:hypothetical protein
MSKETESTQNNNEIERAKEIDKIINAIEQVIRPLLVTFNNTQLDSKAAYIKKISGNYKRQRHDCFLEFSVSERQRPYVEIGVIIRMESESSKTIQFYFILPSSGDIIINSISDQDLQKAENFIETNLSKINVKELNPIY